MPSNPAKYVIITPVRDEEEHLGLTVECMLRQSILPTEWIIVNDGSTDATGKIIDEYAKQYAWIRGVHRQNRGFRKSGGGVVEAFNAGYETLQTSDWDFIVKLDGDLSFDPQYFEKCFQEFERDPTLGITGGGIYHVTDGHEDLEKTPVFHVRGATKIYRAKCWREIGGFWPAPGWDTFDEIKALRLGWTTRSLPELRLLHHRQTGAADGVWGGLKKNGRANYICGYHPLFMIAKCLRRLPRKPYMVGATALMYGYLHAYFTRTPQVNDPSTIRYLRHQQILRLTGQETIWR